MDNGPKCSGQALDAWAYQHHVTLECIEPSKPLQTGYLQNCTAKVRDECLTIHWFRSLADARRLIEDWRTSYNTERPHSALCGDTPAAYAVHYQAVGSLASSLGTSRGSGQ
jgi:putative transposase